VLLGSRRHVLNHFLKCLYLVKHGKKLLIRCWTLVPHEVNLFLLVKSTCLISVIHSLRHDLAGVYLALLGCREIGGFACLLLSFVLRM